MDRAPRILIVEDVMEDVELMRIVLEEIGLHEETAVVRDGVEALDYLNRRGAYCSRARGNPELLLLDLKMSKLSGLEVLRQIRAEEEFNAFSVVIFSSSLDEKDRDDSLACGANEYVVKPIDFEEFQEVITRVAKTYIAR